MFVHEALLFEGRNSNVLQTTNITKYGIIVTRNGWIVSKHGPNRPFYGFENQAILAPILLYRASKYKQTKNPGC